MDFQSLYAQYTPWTDRAGRLSWFKLALFVVLLLPGVFIAMELSAGQIGPEPFEHQIHETGEWAIRFLILTLLVSPLRAIFSWNKVIAVRRMIGLAGFAYAFAHFVLYIGQENWDLAEVTSEIIRRLYLTIGFAAVVILSILAATSFDSVIRKMGANWRRLHWLVYPAVVLGLYHFFLQAKSDVFQPTLLAGLFLLLMLYRFAGKVGYRKLPWWVLLVCVPLVTGLTALVEYAWYDLATGIPADRVFLANFQVFQGGNMRPAILVGIVALLMAVTAFGAGFFRSRSTR